MTAPDVMSTSTNLVDQLESAGLSWRAYMESVPSRCFKPKSAQDEQGLYAKRHNPFFYFDDVRSDPRRCAEVVPYTQLARDASSSTGAAGLPLDHAERLQRHPRLPGARAATSGSRRTCPRCSTPWVRNQRSSSPGTRVSATTGAAASRVADGSPWSPSGRRFARALARTGPRTHYSLLRTIEDVFGLPALRHATPAGRPRRAAQGALGDDRLSAAAGTVPPRDPGTLPACRSAGSTRCSPSAGSPARGPAPPSPCAPAGCESAATARSRRSRAS